MKKYTYFKATFFSYLLFLLFSVVSVKAMWIESGPIRLNFNNIVSSSAAISVENPARGYFKVKNKEKNITTYVHSLLDSGDIEVLNTSIFKVPEYSIHFKTSSDKIELCLIDFTNKDVPCGPEVNSVIKGGFRIYIPLKQDLSFYNTENFTIDGSINNEDFTIQGNLINNPNAPLTAMPYDFYEKGTKLSSITATQFLDYFFSIIPLFLIIVLLVGLLINRLLKINKYRIVIFLVTFIIVLIRLTAGFTAFGLSNFVLSATPDPEPSFYCPHFGKYSASGYMGLPIPFKYDHKFADSSPKQFSHPIQFINYLFWVILFFIITEILFKSYSPDKKNKFNIFITRNILFLVIYVILTWVIGNFLSVELLC